MRGFCADWAAHRTIAFERGWLWYPANLCVVRGGVLQTYDKWMACLAARGVNLVRIRLMGRNVPWDGGGCGFEPPPAGTFNIWHSVLDPGDLERYRSDQVTSPVDPALWEASNLCQLVQAAERHGVKLWVTLFEYREFKQQPVWRCHAWNSENQYINGERCEERDRGMVADPRLIFTDAACIQAAKDRLQFVLDVIGDSPAVACWEIMNEMIYLAYDNFWQEGWGAMPRNIREKMVPWIQTLTDYLHEHDPLRRPVANSQGRAPRDHVAWPDDPDHIWNLHAELFDPVDVVSARGYGVASGGLVWLRDELRLLQERFPDKQVVFGEYWPFPHGEEPAAEHPPYQESKAVQWLAACAGSMAMRWNGLEEEAVNIWLRGGYADPDLHKIAGVTRALNEVASWDSWNWEAARSWDGNISAEEAEVTAGYGDGRRVTLFVQWPDGGPKVVEINSLATEEYDLYTFDWIAGSPAETRRLIARDGRLAFGYEEKTLAACLIAVDWPGCRWPRRRRISRQETLRWKPTQRP